MHRFTSQLRQPVKRQGADQYLLIILLSFAGSVILTRIFLELTGYPQLGGGELHIAHVLWGGLLLFIAALLPLLVANRWVYTLGAFLAGTGVGLFIDEVGKFITSTNNYFYPLAAPIIYAFFLLTAFLYTRIRRPPSRGARAELYRAFDSLGEVLEHDLDPRERSDLVERLQYVAAQSDQPDLARLARELLDFLDSPELQLAPPRPTIWARLDLIAERMEKRWLTRLRLKAVLIGGLLALGIVGLVNMVNTLPLGSNPTHLTQTLTQLVNQGQIKSSGGLTWFLARLVLETSVGVMQLLAAALLLKGDDETGIAFGYLGLLLSLTTVNLLIFYYDQFSTILTASLELGVLLAVGYYRHRYVIKGSSKVEQPEGP
jgi:hypothetical protein